MQMKPNQISLGLNLPMFSISFDFVNRGGDDAELMVDIYSMYDILSNYQLRMLKKIEFKSFDASSQSEAFDTEFFGDLDNDEVAELMHENINLIVNTIETLPKCIFHCKKFIEYCIKHKSDDLLILKNAFDEIRIHLINIDDEVVDTAELNNFLVYVHKYLISLFNKVNDLIVTTTSFPKMKK